MCVCDVILIYKHVLQVNMFTIKIDCRQNI